MEFSFSKEEELWQWAVKDFVERELAPREFTNFDGAFRNVIKKMAELGFSSLNMPEKCGGNPGNWVMLGILAEEIAKVNMTLAYSVMISYEVALSLAMYGTHEAKEEWLTGLINGSRLGCIAMTEPDAGTDFGAITAAAVKDGDCYLVSGEKVPVSFGMPADVALCFVKTGSESTKSVTAMFIPLDLPGVSRLPLRTMGLSLSSPASIRFEGVQIPAKYRFGKEGEGISVNETTCFHSTLHQTISGLIALGAAQTALRLAIRYSKERCAFGRPIGQFEAISGKIAEDATVIEAGRWLCYRALFLKDQGSPNDKEAAMCGWWCPKTAHQVIQDSLLIHGHAGYCDDHPFQQMLRDTVAFEMISGTEHILKLIIGHETMGSVAVPDSVSGRIGHS
jgi:cyclohexanecarboxyl-CoA dehydrogenase